MLPNGIAVTWATPVDAAELGARMESYVETKASVHVFRLCVEHAQPGAPLGRLSPELIDIIATEVQHATFKKRLETWQQNTRCCAGTCRPSEHLNEEDYASLKEDYLMEIEGSEVEGHSGCHCGHCLYLDELGVGHCLCDFDWYLDERGVGHDEHIETVETFLAKVENNTYVGSRGRFSKCRKVCSILICPTLETKQAA